MTLPPPSPPIPANKYFPPKSLPGMTLHRARLLQLMATPPSPNQFFFLEAQAGQGKTILAAQLLEQLGLPFLWYQTGHEDRDPMVFLSCLLNGFLNELEGFASPVLQAQLESGRADLVDLPQLLQTFCRDLSAFLAQRGQRNRQVAVLVLDDVHLLEASEKSLGLLDTLLETLPDTMAVMLLSRSPVPLRSKRVRFGGKTLYLGNRELAMTRDEGVELIALLLHGLPEPAVLNTLLQQAGGWPMGLVLATQNHAAGSAGQEWRQETASGYLERELLMTLEPSQRFVALQLSLLDEIPLDLAQRISPDTDMSHLLTMLVTRNFFLRFLNNEGTLFGFHHLFLSFLQQKARNILTPEEQAQVFSLAAAYYLNLERPGKAMEYQLKALDFPALEQTMERFGQALLAKGQHMTLHALLAAIPESRVQQSAWFSYFLGLTLQVHDPLTALQAFHRARTIFHETGHAKGELLTTSNILYLYIIHSTILPRSEAIHPDVAHALYEQAGAELPPFCRITTTHNIALGYLYFLNDFKKTRHYNDLTRELARQSMLPNMLLSAQLASGWADNMSGELDKAIGVIEYNYRLISRKELGFHNRMQLFLFQLDITRSVGGINNFINQRDEFVGWAGAATIDRTFAAPWLVLWHIELACKDGDFDTVRKICESKRDTFSFQAVSNFRGELHAWLALQCAVTGQETERIPSLLGETQEWLNQGGASPFHFSKAMLLTGNVYRILGQYDEALQCFQKAQAIAQGSGIPHLFCRSLLNQALIYDILSDREKMTQALQSGLEILTQETRYTLMSGFYPEIALRVLRLAHDAGIQPEFCKKYAWEHLGTALSAKKNIPLLSIRILGGFGLALSGELARDISLELSQIQRKFFGLLLATKTLSAGQLQLQTELWPEIPESKARQRFDTLMSRLRKSLAPVVSPHDAEDYVLLEKGVVTLTHCRVDASEFCALVEQGRRYLNQGAWWQAGNHFTHALDLWKGGPAVELLDLRQGTLTEQPVRCLTSMAEAWRPALLELGRNEQALAVCETAWNEDKANHNLTRHLYEIQIAAGAIAQGRRIVDAFATASRELGLNEGDVESLVSRITSFAA